MSRTFDSSSDFMRRDAQQQQPRTPLRTTSSLGRSELRRDSQRNVQQQPQKKQRFQSGKSNKIWQHQPPSERKSIHHCLSIDRKRYLFHDELLETLILDKQVNRNTKQILQILKDPQFGENDTLKEELLEMLLEDACHDHFMEHIMLWVLHERNTGNAHIEDILETMRCGGAYHCKFTDALDDLDSDRIDKKFFNIVQEVTTPGMGAKLLMRHVKGNWSESSSDEQC
ncbi:hypothetical protein HDV05_004190 [Chytridiales sp. JEL 0842]|nr:hypothetical protein HDV05_004190 [Chytridiales sp. JEL 0842]